MNDFSLKLSAYLDGELDADQTGHDRMQAWAEKSLAGAAANA